MPAGQLSVADVTVDIEVSATDTEVGVLSSVELFAGAGGLAMGMSVAGFEHKLLVENDPGACDTINENIRLGTVSWPRAAPTDAGEFDFSPFEGVSLVSGGPPCQPFSVGGRRCGGADPRNMIPTFVGAVGVMMPSAFVMENVSGLVTEKFRVLFDFYKRWLESPRTSPADAEVEKWADSDYDVYHKILDAADYGTPQRRKRVIVIGFKKSLGIVWEFPEATHSADALAWDQWVSGEYWERHNLSRPMVSGISEEKMRHLRASSRPSEMAWLTVRDAITELGQPGGPIANHEYYPEWFGESKSEWKKIRGWARSYQGHTGSIYDKPAKALRAGTHGVSGGENMLAEDPERGVVRYFTVREAATLQQFPKDYVFKGNWTQVVRQLGNAVPVGLGTVLGRAVAARLKG